MTNRHGKILPRLLILFLAVPALVWFPWAFCLVIVSGEQLLFGFDDFPMIPMILSLGVGVFVAVTWLVIVCRDLWRGLLRLPLIITVTAVVFGALAVPAARLMTRLVEQ